MKPFTTDELWELAGGLMYAIQQINEIFNKRLPADMDVDHIKKKSDYHALAEGSVTEFIEQFRKEKAWYDHKPKEFPGDWATQIFPHLEYLIVAHREEKE